MKSADYSTVNFFKMLRNEKSIEIFNDMSTFTNFTFRELCENAADIEILSNAFQEFVIKTTNDFAKLWEIDLMNDKEAYVEISNGIEQLLSKALYDRIMCKIGEDTVVEKQVAQCCKMTSRHLGLGFEIDERFSEITYKRTPKEKCECVVNMCKYLTVKYFLLKGNFSFQSEMAGLLVYVIIRSGIPNLKAQLTFCALFRNKTSIDTNEDYYLSLFFQGYELLEMISNKGVRFRENESEAAIDSRTRASPVLENSNDGILNLPFGQLYNEYFSSNVKEFSLSKFEKLRNDFKIVLKLIESLKIEYH